MNNKLNIQNCKKVSVIIPVYNSEKYLSECLDSVLQQTLEDVEVICVNDASSDGSAKILSQYEECNKNSIKILELEQNGGQANARNIGVENAEGEYIFFMDSDDLLADSNALKILYENAISNDIQGIFFESLTFYETKELEYAYKSGGGQDRQTENLSKGIYTGKEILSAIYKQVDVSATVWRQFWNKKFLKSDKWLMFDVQTSPSEDYLFTFCSMLLAKKILYLPEALYMYRMRENSSTTVPYDLKRFFSHVNCYFGGMRFLEEHIDIIDIDKSIIYFFKELIRVIRGCQIILIKSGVNVENCMADKKVENLYMNLIMTGEYTYLDRLLTTSEYECIKESKKIVIYGAGKVGEEVASMLKDFGINNYCFAVTSKRDDDNTVQLITDFADEVDTVMVILAVTKKYKTEMKKIIENIGFKKVLCFNESL